MRVTGVGEDTPPPDTTAVKVTWWSGASTLFWTDLMVIGFEVKISPFAIFRLVLSRLKLAEVVGDMVTVTSSMADLSSVAVSDVAPPSGIDVPPRCKVSFGATVGSAGCGRLARPYPVTASRPILLRSIEPSNSVTCRSSACCFR